VESIIRFVRGKAKRPDLLKMGLCESRVLE
jgi:hypothetical protein